MSGTWASTTVWNVPYGTVLRRKDDGETVMVTGGVNQTGWLRAVVLVLPREADRSWAIRPGDAVAEFIYGTDQWEVVE